MNDIDYKTALWCDLKTDEQRSKWLLLGRGYETGVVSHSIQNDLSIAYNKLAILKNLQDSEEANLWRLLIEAVDKGKE